MFFSSFHFFKKSGAKNRRLEGQSFPSPLAWRLKLEERTEIKCRACILEASSSVPNKQRILLKVPSLHFSLCLPSLHLRDWLLS
jgi:hypothetical protein